jgi:AcrR family transcriptional regulator
VAASNRPEGHERDAVGRAEIQDRAVAAVADVEAVLDSGDGRDRAGLGELFRVDVADAEMADQSFFPQTRERLEAFGEGFAVRDGHHADSQVDEVEALETEGREVRFDEGTKIGGLCGRGALGTEDRADLGRDHEVWRIGMKSFADQNVGSHGAVTAAIEVRRVDVVHTELDRAAQNGAAGFGIARRAVPAGGREAHRAEAESVDREVAAETKCVDGSSVFWDRSHEVEGPPFRSVVTGGTSGWQVLFAESAVAYSGRGLMRREPRKSELVPLRSDAQRNRDDILAAAVRAFTKDANASLEGIAKAAGVGIGTLYRHFPTREVLFEAAYRNEIKKLCDAAPELSKRHPPDVAMERFLERFIDHMEEKPGMMQAVRGVVAAGGTISESLAMVRAVITPIIEAGRAEGVLRDDVSVEDFIIIKGAIANARPERARRLAVLLIDGLRSGAKARRRASKARTSD